MKNRNLSIVLLCCFFLLMLYSFIPNRQPNIFTRIKEGFLNPPDSCRPGVYWYFMDGNISKEGITKDLESMKEVGIGSVIFLEVNAGVPRGKVDFFSEEWQNLFTYAEKECERLGIEMILGTGPGWAGSGGPWVKPEESMQHLVAGVSYVSDTSKLPLKLEVPSPRKPYFGEHVLTPELRKEWEGYYKNVSVIAFPMPDTSQRIPNIDEKALYYRAPFSSGVVKPYLPEIIDSLSGTVPIISKDKIIDLTDKLLPDGSLDWNVPKGSWMIMRFVARNNGAVTRPAPVPGLGFEANKMDTAAINHHLGHYVGALLNKIGDTYKTAAGGLKRLHIDSWEMGAQNWTDDFRSEFIKNRGYDPLPYYPVYLGFIVGNKNRSERFLWDLRQTAQEMVLKNHALQVKKYAHDHGLRLSIEPYDMNPAGDLELGNIADVPMAEFWSRNRGDLRTEYSVIEATSVAHVNGIHIVPAESFTAHGGWLQYPGNMKEEGDWALAAGINKFMFHTFQNQSLPDSLKPGMTMGPYGVQWNRNQTWWPMAGAYHTYLARCNYMLQRGNSVADILFLNPEGSPFVFSPPSSALDNSNKNKYPDRRGYNFDGCAPSQLYKAQVNDHKIVFPGGASYRVLVLPNFKTMTPGLLNKIKSLVVQGAQVIGAPPVQSPGLSGYPRCDQEVKTASLSIWKTLTEPKHQSTVKYGNGCVVWGGGLHIPEKELYPNYDAIAAWLHSQEIPEDFHSSGDIRYIHRTLQEGDIYFIANKTDKKISETISFRSVKGAPQLWDPINGDTRNLPVFDTKDGCTNIPVSLDAYESYFVIFTNEGASVGTIGGQGNFPEKRAVKSISGSWNVSFDTRWGGPDNITFDNLYDWTASQDSGVKYYSGIAVYDKVFDMEHYQGTKNYILDLGNVKNIACVRLNGKDFGVVWAYPWQKNITSALKKGRNHLEISVANLWVNRLIGDEAMPWDGPVNKQWPEWLLNGEPRPSKRYTFVTNNPVNKNTPLSPSGLLGPVRILEE
ncbi:MAG: glycosyl hydrolase [Arachidicoccus sp.]|nr:glycosyl hydrolase [Arachidicoccus sp.]